MYMNIMIIGKLYKKVRHLLNLSLGDSAVLLIRGSSVVTISVCFKGIKNVIFIGMVNYHVLK